MNAWLPRAATGIALLALLIVGYALTVALHQVIPEANSKIVDTIVAGLLMVISGIVGWMIRDHQEPRPPAEPPRADRLDPPQPPAS